MRLRSRTVHGDGAVAEEGKQHYCATAADAERVPGKHARKNRAKKVSRRRKRLAAQADEQRQAAAVLLEADAATDRAARVPANSRHRRQQARYDALRRNVIADLKQATPSPLYHFARTRTAGNKFSVAPRRNYEDDEQEDEAEDEVAGVDDDECQRPPVVKRQRVIDAAEVREVRESIQRFGTNYYAPRRLRELGLDQNAAAAAAAARSMMAKALEAEYVAVVDKAVALRPGVRISFRRFELGPDWTPGLSTTPVLATVHAIHTNCAVSLTLTDGKEEITFDDMHEVRIHADDVSGR